MSKTWKSIQTAELAHAWAQVEENHRGGGKPEWYLQFDFLQQYPQLMEAGGLRLATMNWNMTPGLFKWTLGLPTIVVPPKVWLKWTEPNNTQWEPNEHAGNFWPGIALVVCRTPYYGHCQENLWQHMVTSMAVVYIPEDWTLASFTEMAFMINKVKEDTQGVLSLTRLHKDTKFYPDISYADYGQHMTLVPLVSSSSTEFEGCGAAENFAVGALHQWPEQYCKSKNPESWVPLAF